MSGEAVRAGSYERKLQTKAGEVKLKVPRLRSLPFESQIIERYRRRESSVEEALMEMYLAGVSARWSDTPNAFVPQPQRASVAHAEVAKQLICEDANCRTTAQSK